MIIKLLVNLDLCFNNGVSRKYLIFYRIQLRQYSLYFRLIYNLYLIYNTIKLEFFSIRDSPQNLASIIQYLSGIEIKKKCPKLTRAFVNFVRKKSVLIGKARVKISENANYHGEIINYVVAALLSLFFFYVTPFLFGFLSFPLHPTSFCLSLAFFRDANYVKYSHDTRMLLQDHGLTVVPVDDSLNCSQRFPLRFQLRDFASFAVVVVQHEISKRI